MEAYVLERIAGMVAGEHVPSGNLLFQVPSDGEVDTLLAEFQVETGLNLTKEQKQAVWLALTQRCCLVSGGAGTGKTTLLKAVIHCFEHQGGTVHPVALAGRAACRISEATGHPARTLAGFLGAVEREELRLGDGHLVVVDESSMVDLPLAYALLSALPLDCRVLWTGDQNQLTPIGPGIVFSAYCNPGDDRIPKVELTKVHRQAASTGIPLFAGLIRQGQVSELPAYAGPGVGISFIEATEQAAMPLVIELLGDLGGTEECQILGAIKNGPIGMKAVNASLHRLRAVGRDEWQGYTAGDPVIWLTNDYERRLFNGTLGMVESVGKGSATVLWDGHEQPLAHVFEDLECLDLAYGITIHKSQGSQFRRVIVPVFPTRLLDRTLLYTAVTRASEQVVLLGDPAAMVAAIEAPPAPRRRLTGMGSGVA
jgi:exodeoxyribonuclease V alpha subunit